MVRKKVDNRIKILVENNVKLHHRTFFVIVGDKAREQVVNLHYMLSKARVKSRPNVLWCYKKDLGFISDDRSRYKHLKKLQKKQKLEEDELLNDPFNLFISATDIRFCYFKETKNILGNTYGMLVVQDFEAITPNILARTIETVEGGGMIIFLLPKMNSLKQLYTMAMDVHARFRTESQHDVVPRFNERFLLSLTTCKSCLVLDDQLNILPLSSHVKDIEPIVVTDSQLEQNHILSSQETELKKLKESLRETQPIGSLIQLAKTYDQAKVLMQFVEAISEKTLQTTVTLTAARGRGKSAALGMSIVAAIAYGYSNIFVTAPSPENLKTLFEFVFKAFDALGYKDQLDYEIVQSTNPNFKKAVVRVNIFREHRQTIQYIQPRDYQKLAQAELVVIDEAAAIPLPIVKKLMGPYLVFLSSTITGYEGTGRSLSLKLIKQLREKSNESLSQPGAKGRKLIETKLEEPIRYKDGDQVEKWLYKLLCLEATAANIKTDKVPHPDQCELYYVNRDTLFSFHEASEQFLHNMMALYVSSHYKNSPNDLQIMSDAPAHHLFVLLGPIDENTTQLPDIFAVIQIAFEGKINKDIIMAQLAKGVSPSGDLIPFLVSRQYQETEFGQLSGIRIVRIATHPDFQRMGYGTRALKLLEKYFKGEIYDTDEKSDSEEETTTQPEKAPEKSQLQTEVIQPREQKPLLQILSQRPPEKVHYMGTSFGVTQSLYSFWQKNGYIPIYLRLTPNELTGEHTCVMLKNIETSEDRKDWLESFSADFKKRLVSLLSYDFRAFPTSLALSLLDYKLEKPEEIQNRQLSVAEMDLHFSNYDLKRLNAYARSLVDYHVILDLVPSIAKLYFLGKFQFSISYAQAAILIGLGLQRKQIHELPELNMESNQILALFNKVIRKVVAYLKQVEKQRYVKVNQIEEPNEQKVDGDSKDAQSSTKSDNTEEGAPKKRKSDETQDRPKKKRKKDKKTKEFINEVLSNKNYKIVGITNSAVEDATLDRTGSGTVSIKTEIEGTEEYGGRSANVKFKKHMLKDPKEVKREKKEMEMKRLFKKGGKKKRKLLRQ